MTLYFVYGTLMRGGGNSHILEESEFIGPGVTVLQYSMLGGGYPIVTAPSGKVGRVRGEVYNVRSRLTRRRLDVLEGVPHMYRRARVRVVLGDGRKIRCRIYIGSDDFVRAQRQHRREVDPILEWRSR